MANKKDNDSPAIMVETIPTVVQEQDGCSCRKVHTYKGGPSYNKCNGCSNCTNKCSCSNTSWQTDKNCCCPSCIKSGPVCDSYGTQPLPSPKRKATVDNDSLYVVTAEQIIYPAPGFYEKVKLLGADVADCQPLTSKNYGTLHVKIAVDEFGELCVNLENKDISGNSSDLVGTPLPCGTEFFPGGAVSTVSESSNCNNLLADFHIPSVNAASPAKVSSFVDFTVGEQAVLRNKQNPAIAYIYDVASLSGTDIVNLTNTGNGGNPGDIISSDKDCDGEPDWCIEPFGEASICDKAVETQCITHLLGCDANGNLVKIKGSLDKEAPVFDVNCGGYTNQVVEKTSVCRDLVSCFQLPVYGDDPCDRPMIFIETSDDAFILDLLEEALLTDTGYPVLEVCGKLFIVDLAGSQEGAIKIIPTFPNPDAVIKFDEGCKVCVPEDCCTQCTPQVNFPIPELSPNNPDGFGSGLNPGYGMTIPAAALPAAGEYGFTVVQNETGDSYYLLAHNLTTGSVTAAYNPDGSVKLVSEIPGDINNDYAYYQTNYCNGEKCPVRAYIEEDIISDVLDIPTGCCVTRNQYGFLLTDNCIWPDDPPRATQYNIPTNFVGGGKISGLSNPPGKAWITATPARQSYAKQGGSRRRSFQLDVGDCLEIKIEAYYLVSCDAAAAGDIILSASSTLLLATEVY